MLIVHLVFLCVPFLIHCLAIYCYLLVFLIALNSHIEIFVSKTTLFVCFGEIFSFLWLALLFIPGRISCFINKNKCKSIILIVSKLMFSFMTCAFSFCRIYFLKVFSFVQSINLSLDVSPKYLLFVSF